MHPVMLGDGEVALLKQAKEENDWTILPTSKLRYLFQRLVALPRGDIKTVKLIASEAYKLKYGKTREEVAQTDGELAKVAGKIFGIE